MSLQLNGLYKSDGMQVLLEENYYQRIDVVFPFICAF